MNQLEVRDWFENGRYFPSCGIFAFVSQNFVLVCIKRGLCLDGCGDDVLLLLERASDGKRLMVRTFVHTELESIQQNDELIVYQNKALSEQKYLWKNYHFRMVYPSIYCQQWNNVIIESLQVHQFKSDWIYLFLKETKVIREGQIFRISSHKFRVLKCSSDNPHDQCFAFGIVNESTEIAVIPFGKSFSNQTEAMWFGTGKNYDQELHLKLLIESALYSMNHNIQSPRSLLITGTPGVGKNSIVKSIARKFHCFVATLSPADVYSKFYEGEDGLSNLSQLLEQSLKFQPSIILIDEIDVLLPENELEKDKYVIHEFIQILDRLSRDQPKAILIGIATEPEKLDSFLRKKFDEEIRMDIPLHKERLKIFQNLFKQMPLAKDVDAESINDLCHGYVQSDIFTICKLASINALKRRNKSMQTVSINANDFKKSIQGYKPYSIRQATMALTIPQVPQVQWDEIAGLHSVKEKIQKLIVDPIKYSEVYSTMGIHPPSGILLYGPPGTGKTLLAKAVATASQSNFISISIPDIIRSEIGESEKTLASVFRRAKLSSPTVVFFDEFQAMFGHKSFVSKSQQKLISQLLLELDELEYSRDSCHVILIAATNVPQNIDTAVLRPKRIEYCLYVGPPDESARRKIFKDQFQSINVDKEVIQRVEELVSLTEGYTGADIVNICQKAGLTAIQRNKNFISFGDFSIMEQCVKEDDQFLKNIRT